MDRDRACGFGVGLLVGAVIGGVVGLLYAPKSGKETRHLIKDKATEAIDAVREAGSEVRRKGQAAVNALKS